jgi:Raf kinase inhibitor-like YbhB/YbcL family protein
VVQLGYIFRNDAYQPPGVNIMKPRLHLSLAALCFAAGLVSAQPGSFEVSSPTFSPLSTLHVLKGFDCEGGNQSPELHWANAPEGTKSFAVTLYDPDAPTGSGWWHWVVYDIPASETGLAADAGNADGTHLPGKAVQGRTDFGTPGFGGACPPVGDAPHRYVLTVHALGVDTLPAPADATAAMVGFLIHANSLGSAVLETRYGR